MTRRRVLDYVLAALLVLLPVLLLRANLRDSADLSRLDKAVLRISSPIQAAVAWGIEGVGGVFHRYIILVDVEQENQELREENSRLRQRLLLATRGAKDASMLESLVGLKQRQDAETIGARIIARSVNSYFRVIRVAIDRGEHEVAPGMPVMNADGLVGRISHSFGRYSDVLLISDPSSAIDVTISRLGANGVLRGLGRNNSFLCEIGLLDRGKAIEVGDQVVTSGLGTLPAGLAVGEVVRVTSADYELFQTVEVRPAVDLANPGALIVLTAAPPPPDPLAGKRRDLPAFGMVPR